MRRSVLLPALLLPLAACASTPAAPAAPPSPPPVVLLVKLETRGGLCVSGTTCESGLTVKTDGSWTSLAPDGRRSGTLPEGRLARLADAVERTGLATAPPFTGTCPIAYDGQEQVVTWLDDGKPVTVASCEQEFDPADPLVAALDELTRSLA